jgi:parallel beta-helix repeat protein
MHARGIPLATLLLLALAATPVHATTAVVPDSFPTIQAGIDSGRDTVLVRGGRYDEDLTGDQLCSSLTLLAYPPSDYYGSIDLPQVGSLTFPGQCPSYTQVDLLVRGFRFRGKVAASPHNSSVTFETCRMDSGLSVGNTVNTARVSGCTILGELYAMAMAVNITLNSVYGGGIKVFGDGYYTIRGNYVHGPAPFGIISHGSGSASIEGNTVTGVDVGVHILGDGGLVRDNTVTDCNGSAFLGAGGGLIYERNEVARCGGYAFEGGGSAITLRHNQAVDCASGGVRILYGCEADSNVVGRCGGPGFDLGSGSLRGNTSYLSQGTGYIVREYGHHVTNNIAYGNLGVGLSYLGTGVPVLACNDWFANTGGATSGVLPGPTDLAVDPLFCDLSADDVHLSAGSPLLDASGCGLIGALGQGCLGPAGVSPPSESLVRAFTVSPNPSRGAVHFSWASSDRPERLDVYDVTGARRWSSSITAGASALQWPSIDREGAQLPAGIYYARLTSRGTSATARFVLVQ